MYSLSALYDIKATDMGSQSVMFKAEVDIDGREITRSYLERVDIQLILEVCHCHSPTIVNNEYHQ
jgi:solute carrier family 30 (zinc transporter), member 9